MFALNAIFAFPLAPDATVTLIDAVFIKLRETAFNVDTLLPETRTVFAALLAVV